MNSKKIWIPLFLFWTLTLLCVSIGFAKTEVSSQSANGFYDAKILDGSGLSADEKKPKKKKHKKHKKGAAKAGNSNSAPGDPQEEVTDQKEVSSQADQSTSKHKK